MLIAKNLYLPPKIMKYEKDLYPLSTYELDGYTSYSWGKSIPKYDTEINKNNLSRCWNNYYGKIVIYIPDLQGTLRFNYFYYISENSMDDKQNPFTEVIEDNENQSLICIGKAGSYPTNVSYIINEEEVANFDFIITIYPNKINNVTLRINDYLEEVANKELLLNLFNSSPELQVNFEDRIHYKYYPGYSYSYARDHLP